MASSYCRLWVPGTNIRGMARRRQGDISSVSEQVWDIGRTRHVKIHYIACSIHFAHWFELKIRRTQVRVHRSHLTLGLFPAIRYCDPQWPRGIPPQGPARGPSDRQSALLNPTGFSLTAEGSLLRWLMQGSGLHSNQWPGVPTQFLSCTLHGPTTGSPKVHDPSLSTYFPLSSKWSTSSSDPSPSTYSAREALPVARLPLT